MTPWLRQILCAALPVLLTAAVAAAQAPATPPGALAPEAIQPWGLPPPPPGIGPVELFADIHDTPQGKFLEGGAFDTDGNFWFVESDRLMSLYPAPVREYISAHGGLPPPWGTMWVSGPALRGLVKPCE
jgi:gluconolactonase